jgi:hypothetical protein
VSLLFFSEHTLNVVPHVSPSAGKIAPAPCYKSHGKRGTVYLATVGVLRCKGQQPLQPEVSLWISLVPCVTAWPLQMQLNLAHVNGLTHQVSALCPQSLSNYCCPYWHDQWLCFCVIHLVIGSKFPTHTSSRRSPPLLASPSLCKPAPLCKDSGWGQTDLI